MYFYRTRGSNIATLEASNEHRQLPSVTLPNQDLLLMQFKVIAEVSCKVAAK
jgi:hypothetical protein